MPSLTRTGLTYPSRGQPRWFDVFERFLNGLDAILYSHREDRNIVLVGGGTVSWDATASELTFTDDISLWSPIKGWMMTIDQATYSPIASIGNGTVVYVEIVRAPGQAISLVPRVSTVVPDGNNAILLAYRSGTDLYLRNGVGFAHGSSGAIFAQAA